MAVHTLGDDCVVNQELLNALVAGLVLTIQTLDFFMGGLVEFLDTNRAFHGVDCLICRTKKKNG